MDKSTFGSRVNTLCRIGENDRLLCALDSLIGILPEVKTQRDVAKFLIMNKQYGINIGTFVRTYINVDPGAESEIKEIVDVRNAIDKYHYFVRTEFWTEKDTETFLKEREVLDEINKLTWSFVKEAEAVEKLGPILQKLEDMYPGIDAAKYIKLHTSGPIHDLVSKVIETPNTHYDLDDKVLSVIKSDTSMENKANSFCDILEETEHDATNKVDKEYVESVLTELLQRDCLDKSYDCQHLLILYKDLHPEAVTANEAAKLILDRLSGYDKYCFGEIYAEYAHSVGIAGYDILKEEESLAQQVIDMFPPSLAKEYHDNNKIMWALKLALHNK